MTNTEKAVGEKALTQLAEDIFAQRNADVAAINEQHNADIAALNERIDSIPSSEEAIETANEAKTTAEEALTDASLAKTDSATAKATAESASTTAQSAADTAANAAADAATAANVARAAAATVDSVASVAEAARDKANVAESTANTATSNINLLDTRVDSIVGDDEGSSMREIAVEVANEKVAGLYKTKGTAIFEDGQVKQNGEAVTEVAEGWVYNIQNKFTTTDDFVDGAGIKVKAGMNIAARNTGTEEEPVMKWDLLGSSFDIDFATDTEVTTAVEEAFA